MEKYRVTGMSCAACSARVEKAVSKVEGVTSCSVSLLTNSMGVEGSAKEEDIISAVKKAGYGASKENNISHNNESYSGRLDGGETYSRDGSFNSDNEDYLKDKETPALKKRLIASFGFLIVLMYISMGHMMWNWPLPQILYNNHIAMGLIQMLLTIAIMVINQRFFISGFRGLINGTPNMDTLVALGSTAAFVYSTWVLFAMTDAATRGDVAQVEHLMHEFYFESAAMILTLITLGKMLEARAKGKTTDALKGLIKLAPKTATLVKDGKESVVAVSQVKTGDTFVVKPGESIPVDGVVVKGSSAVNESALTGESIPVDKQEGDSVSAATINQSGHLVCTATRVGQDTTLSVIIRMVSDAAATKAPVAKVADRVSGVFVPAVIVIAVITTIVWMIAGQSIGYAMARGISVLVISCPCALGLATPVAIMVGNGMGAKHGIMFKTAASLEMAGKVQIAVMDKTGTITRGEPEVTDVFCCEEVKKNELLRLAFELEKMSEHPLGKAVVKYVSGLELEMDNYSNDKGDISDKNRDEVTGFRVLPGNGLSGMYRGKNLVGGSLKYISNQVDVDYRTKTIYDEYACQGKTPVLFAYDDKILGVIAIADVIKEESPEAVRQLKNMGIAVVMLTGDNERTARAMGKQAGVDYVVAEVLPDEKEKVIKKLQTLGKVAMIGDGINDAPALTRADTSIAIGAGTDIAIDAADVVLVKSRLTDVPAAIRLSRATLTNIHENLFWAFFYNIIGIPLAAGVWISLTGWSLNPMFGAAAMSLSSFCVVSNALRLNLFKMNDSGKDKAVRKQVVIPEGFIDMKKEVQKENFRDERRTKNMEKTMKIEGMMCGHCENTVKKALEALEQVSGAEVSHKDGTAVVKLTGEISDDVLRKAVEDKDYKVTSIQ